MSQHTSLSLVDVLDKLLDDHIVKEQAYYGELHRRTDAYKEHVKRRKKVLAKRGSQHDRDLGAMAYREAKEWIEQNPDEREADVLWENTPFQHAIQVLIGEHHLTIVADSGEWDIDGGNPAEEQVREWLMNRRLGGVTGTTPLAAELKRLDTAVVVQGVLRELWSKYPCECEGMGLVQPGPDTLPDETAAEPSKAAGGDGDDTPPATLVFLENPGPDPTRASYGLDCRCVNWYGTICHFSPTQAACVKVLIEHFKHGVPELGEQTILEQVESSQGRLASVFDNGKHPAWGTMIKPGSTKGTFRLAKPGE